VLLGPDGKPLARAPAMTLGAAGEKRGLVKGKKGAKREWEREKGLGDATRKKKKKKVIQPGSHCVFLSRAEWDSRRRRTINLS